MLERAVRAHGNLAEYTPIMLILLYLLETLPATSVTRTALHILGGAFLLGRLTHGICFGFMTSSMPLRIGGTALTLSLLMGTAILLLSLVVYPPTPTGDYVITLGPSDNLGDLDTQ